MFDYEAYATKLRREIHEYPEIGFDLPKTLAVVRRELDAMGIEYTEKWGESSIVATINPEKTNFTIGIRGDMDALPIQEENDVPYKSKNDGIMHACGHDVHTAMLLGTARCLNDQRDSFNCRIKLLFTPAEEYTTPGCKPLAENGVMDDIDVIVAQHVAAECDCGEISILSGGYNGNSLGFTVDMYGKTAHAAQQEKGKDAIMMCVKAYMEIEMMVAKEVNGKEACMLNFGSIHGGNTNNIVCDHCQLFGTLRTWEDEINDYVLNRIREISDCVAKSSGGEAKVEVKKFLPHVINHPVVAERARAAAAEIVGKENVVEKPRGLGGEDFSFLARKKPGAMIRLGVRNPELDCIYPVHNCRFNADERAIGIGIRIFEEFVKQNQNGIEGL